MLAAGGAGAGAAGGAEAGAAGGSGAAGGAAGVGGGICACGGGDCCAGGLWFPGGLTARHGRVRGLLPFLHHTGGWQELHPVE